MDEDDAAGVAFALGGGRGASNESKMDDDAPDDWDGAGLTLKSKESKIEEDIPDSWDFGAGFAFGLGGGGASKESKIDDDVSDDCV